MDLTLTDAQQSASEVARQFAQEELKPIAEKIDEEAKIDKETIKKMGETNLFGLALSENFDGLGLGCVSYVLAMEELAAVSPSVAIMLAHHTMASFMIQAFGNNSIKQKTLSDLSQGDAIGVCTISEPSGGCNIIPTKITGEKTKNGFKVSGNLVFGSNAMIGDYFVIPFKTGAEPGPQSVTMGVVEKERDGFVVGQRENTLGLKGDEVGELVFDNCYIPEENILGKVNRGMEVIMGGGAWGHLGVAATAVGASKACLELSKNYAKERKPFGHPIAEEQVIQTYVSEMNISIEAAHQLLLKTAWEVDQGQADEKDIWSADVHCKELAKKVVDKTQSIYAAHGYTKDYPVERFARDMQGLMYIHGTTEFLKIFLGKMEMEIPLF
ncbi:MAG: acyl-CoA dehydrogenase family protein [Halanaerobiaceae bacterium]